MNCLLFTLDYHAQTAWSEWKCCVPRYSFHSSSFLLFWLGNAPHPQLPLSPVCCWSITLKSTFPLCRVSGVHLHLVNISILVSDRHLKFNICKAEMKAASKQGKWGPHDIHAKGKSAAWKTSSSIRSPARLSNSHHSSPGTWALLLVY